MYCESDCKGLESKNTQTWSVFFFRGEIRQAYSRFVFIVSRIVFVVITPEPDVKLYHQYRELVSHQGHCRTEP